MGLKIMRTKILIAVLVGVVIATGLGFTVRARDDDEDRSGPNRGRTDGDMLNVLKEKVKKLDIDDDLSDVEKGEQPDPSLLIGPKGRVRINSGMVVSSPSGSPSTMTVEIWKLRLNVDVSEARIIPEQNTGTTTSTTTAIALGIGNKVSVKGQMNPDTGVVKAKVVHDHSLRRQNVSKLQEKMRELIMKLREIQQRLGLPLIPLP